MIIHLDVSELFQVGQTVLHVAVSAGKTETVTALLDRGCDSNVLDFVSIIIFMFVGHCKA